MSDTPKSSTQLVAEFLSNASGSSDGPATAGVGGTARVDDGAESVQSQESTTEDLLPRDDGEDTPADSSGEDTAEAKAESGKPQKTSAQKEVITVSDEKGRRKVEVDWNNRDQLRKYVQMAHGARKWQAERDSARTEVAKVAGEKEELQKNWNVLESAYQKQGIAGVIDLLEGKPGAHKEWEKKAIERARFLEDATPEQLEAFRAKEAAEQLRRETAQIRKENEEFRKKISEEKDTADLRSLESKLHPVFDRYRFADKLGDSNDEHMFDEMLWNSALRRLEPYEEKGLPISPELIEREFRAVASAIRKRIGSQAEKKASKAIDQKKQEATENAQAQVRSGYKQSGGAAKEARDLIDGRNLTGLLSNWKKYGSLFNK